MAKPNMSDARNNNDIVVIEYVVRKWKSNLNGFPRVMMENINDIPSDTPDEDMVGSSRMDFMNRFQEKIWMSDMERCNACKDYGADVPLLNPKSKKSLESFGLQFKQRKSPLSEDGSYPMTMEDLHDLMDADLPIMGLGMERIKGYTDAAYVLGILSERGATPKP